MYYAQLLFIYLLLTATWLVFTELWLERAGIFLSLTLVMNSLKGSITRTFNQWYKELMATPVSTTKYRERALLYYAARDFVHLSFEQKFNVGFQMGLCDHYDAMRSEDALEDFIFEKVVRDRIIDDFMVKVRLVRYNEQG